MKSGAKKKLTPSSGTILPKKTDQKKQYRPPRFEVLTPDQAKAQLTERALPGEAATERLLAAASKPGPNEIGQQRSIAREAKVRRN
jgi:hypothetical protein